jgi:hypothetical protein
MFGVATLSLGLIAIGSADGDVTTTLIQTLLLEKSEIELIFKIFSFINWFNIFRPW